MGVVQSESDLAMWWLRMCVENNIAVDVMATSDRSGFAPSHEINLKIRFEARGDDDVRNMQILMEELWRCGARVSGYHPNARAAARFVPPTVLSDPTRTPAVKPAVPDVTMPACMCGHAHKEHLEFAEKDPVRFTRRCGHTPCSCMDYVSIQVATIDAMLRVNRNDSDLGVPKIKPKAAEPPAPPKEPKPKKLKPREPKRSA